MSESNLGVRDFVEGLPEFLATIERQVSLLGHKPEDDGAVQALLGALRAIRGNAARCDLDPIVRYGTQIEAVAEELSTGRLLFIPEVGEALLLAVDLLKLSSQDWAAGRSIEQYALSEAGNALRQLGTNIHEHAARAAHEFVLLVSAGRGAANGELVASGLEQSMVSAPVEKAAGQVGEDLAFFHSLAIQVERHSPFWNGRIDRILPLALKANRLASSPIDPVQLEAAVYLHDFGMVLLPEGIAFKQGKLSTSELQDMRRHSDFAAQLVKRMGGYEGAARMIAEHHERPDGTGYPSALREEQICDGAKLLAIVDGFEAMTHPRADRQFQRSVLRAITEINACENQFSKGWVQHFNTLARNILDVGHR